jgi:hypothetical protein
MCLDSFLPLNGSKLKEGKGVIYTVLSSGFRSSSKLRQQHIGFY